MGTSVLVAGTEHGRQLPAATAVALVLAQACALWWQTRAPVTVLAVNAATELAVWALLPAVTLTGALLAAQVTLCVLSATRPRRISVRALTAMCLAAYLLTVSWKLPSSYGNLPKSSRRQFMEASELRRLKPWLLDEPSSARVTATVKHTDGPAEGPASRIWGRGPGCAAGRA
ncbi:hypothetical protein [Streptomyces sp. NPDC059455]|uniref:hypothetical protein n=1 Tax=Streptomyces sp. NPDC059455 TaxID=3346837 RepID=UPI0036AD4F16